MSRPATRRARRPRWWPYLAIVAVAAGFGLSDRATAQYLPLSEQAVEALAFAEAAGRGADGAEDIDSVASGAVDTAQSDGTASGEATIATTEAPEALAFATGSQTSDTTAGPTTMGGAAAPAADPVTGESAPDEAETALAPPSEEFCDASANIWVQATALTFADDDASPEVTEIAFIRIAEWIERSLLLAGERTGQWQQLLVAFEDFEALVADDHGYNWPVFIASEAYTESDVVAAYQDHQADLVTFLEEDCAGMTITDLVDDAVAQRDDLVSGWGARPSTVVPSDTLPGHSIFTHSAGRLIASFPSNWDYRETSSADSIGFAAAQDLGVFFDGAAVNGIRVQLVEAADFDGFEQLIAATPTALDCTRDATTSDGDGSLVEITQEHTCSGHGAMIVASFRADTGHGLIVEATFDRLEPTDSRLARLASILDSILWS